MALTALLLGLLWRVVDVPAALARLREVEATWVVAGLLLVQLQVVVSALRWRFTAARLGHRIGACRAIGEYYLATLLNQVLPGGVAGDAARTFRGTRRDVRLPDVARGVVVERLAGQLSLVLVALAGLAFWPRLLEAPPPRVALAGVAGLVAFVVVGWLTLRGSARIGPSRWRRAVRSIGPTLRRCWLADRAWVVQGSTSLIVTASYLGVFAIAATATGAPMTAAAVVTIVPLTLASMLLPISIGGWGVRETAAAALWPLAGLGAEAGVAASVFYGLISLAGSLPGVLPLLRGRRAARRADGSRT